LLGGRIGIYNKIKKLKIRSEGGEKSGRPNPAWIKESSQTKKENVK
jgi:hypothetical protein